MCLPVTLIAAMLVPDPRELKMRSTVSGSVLTLLARWSHLFVSPITVGFEVGRAPETAVVH